MKKNVSIIEAVNLATIYEKQNKFYDAIKIFIEILKVYPNHKDVHFNLGVLFKKINDIPKAIDCYQKVIELDPNSFFAHNNLGLVFKDLKKYQKAKDCFEKAILIDPKYAKAHNNLGTSFEKLGEYQKAISYYEKAILIDPKLAIAYSNLGLIFNQLGDNQNTLNCFKKVIELDPGNLNIRYNLGILFYSKKQFKDAAECFKSTDYKNSKSYLLSCLYHLDEKNNFFKEFDNLINKSAINPLIGSLSLRSEIKYGIKKENLFCKNPLKHVLTTNLNEQCDFKNIFTEGVKNILSDKLIIPREQDLITKGQQTAGNIFDLENDFTNKIKNIVLLEIEKYKVYFKDSEEGFLKSWPPKSNLFGWLVSMKNGGNLAPHMHELGWLSGSIYINVPPKLKTDSGNLVLTIDDNDFKNDENSKKNIDVVTGTICLFPSSLHHYTIPFESNEDRIVLAFDVMPG